MIDYRELLKKYIQHVGNTEGITFLADRYWNSNDFTREEWLELNRLNSENYGS